MGGPFWVSLEQEPYYLESRLGPLILRNPHVVDTASMAIGMISLPTQILALCRCVLTSSGACGILKQDSSFPDARLDRVIDAPRSRKLTGGQQTLSLGPIGANPCRESDGVLSIAGLREKKALKDWRAESV